ncbi:hypothetical protein [Methanobacterium ferruginis]|uniref:hypothetical protein n=1 Tax=Methanobacterium ferruginis TaxID=710191 RepID=UPI0025736FA2|nr:hypothetical protein [Methanobacterium ferruginis]BDZ68599.1 hypothetical protein GCM10025860_20470 [Methanobacterium ferruginis]
MAPVDIDSKVASTLDSSEMFLTLGVPQEDEFVQLTGTIDGTNKVFTFPATHYPIYPKNGRTIQPLPADVVIITRKDTTDLIVTVTEVQTITDPSTGFTVYGAVELTAAPTTEGADGVYGKCVTETDLYVQQSIKPKVDQDKGKIGRMGSKKKYTKHGGIDTTIDVEVILSDMQAVLIGNYDEYSGSETVEDGYTLYELKDNPTSLYGCIHMFDGDEEEDPIDREVLGRIVLESVTKDPALPEGKEGDDLTLSFTLNVGEKPKILLKTAAA